MSGAFGKQAESSTQFVTQQHFMASSEAFIIDYFREHAQINWSISIFYRHKLDTISQVDQYQLSGNTKY